MNETIDTMSVAAARRLLRDTSNVPTERVDEAQRAIATFYAARPPVSQRCVACSCMRWEEHTSAAGGASWACASCHRSPDLSPEAWHAQQTRERKAADAHLRATAASAPKPRDTLREALAKLAEARKGLAALEAVLPAARATLAAATLKQARAAEEVEAAPGLAAASLLAGFQGTATGATPSATAVRAALASATDALTAARAAKSLLDEKLSDQRTKVATVQAFARRAAIAVLTAERLEGLLAEATESRATYLESVGQLGWLLRHSGVPSTDGRPRQLVAGADIPPATWPEARTAGAAQMETAMAALLADPEAVI